MDFDQKKAVILDALLEHRGVEHILSAASRVLGNPIAASSRTGIYIGFSRTDEFGDAYWEALQENAPLEGVIHQVEHTGLYARLIASDEVVLGGLDFFNLPILGTRMRDRVDVLGVVYIVGEHPFGEDDGRVLVALARMIALELVYQSQSTAACDRDSTLLADLFAGSITQRQLIAILNGWGLKGAAHMCVLAATFPVSAEITLHLAKSALDMNVDTALCGIYDHDIVLVVDNDLLSSHLLSIIEGCTDGCTAIGISRAFGVFSDIPLAYDQARAAARIAGRLGAKGPFCRYDDIAAYHFLESAAKYEDFARYLDPAVVAIDAYDKENGTDFLCTLRAYIRTGQNMSACADLLYTHRNTVHYRIKRIEELFGIDFSNDERLFSIGLTLRMREIMP